MKNILGIDIGGTKIASGLVSADFQITDLRTEPTSQDDLMAQIAKIIESYRGFEGIGLGMPGQVLPDGTVIKLPNVEKFPETNVKAILEARFNVPVNVMNDSKSFALAEATLGAGKDASVVAGVILGTGVGVGLVINKQLYMGKDGIAGEFDHMVWLSGELFRDQVKPQKPFTQTEAARPYLRTILSLVVLGFNPDMIVLGGGWSTLPGMLEAAQEYLQHVGGYKNQTSVKLSELSNPGIIGAALPLLKK